MVTLFWHGQIFDDLEEDLKLKTHNGQTLVGNTKVWIIILLYFLGGGFLIARFKVQYLNSKLQPFQVLMNKGPRKEQSGLR